jgi:hypothetical protein
MEHSATRWKTQEFALGGIILPNRNLLQIKPSRLKQLKKVVDFPVFRLNHLL